MIELLCWYSIVAAAFADELHVLQTILGNDKQKKQLKRKGGGRADAV